MASSSDPTGPVAPPGIFPAPPGITPDYIHPEVRSFGFVPLSAVFTTLSTFSLALRLYTKGRIIRLLGWDDAVITLAWGTVVTLVGLFGKGLKLGSGAHIWNLRLDNLEEYTKTLVSAVVLSNLASNLPRIAILLFYLRINPAKSFRYGTFAVIWMTTASMLIYVCIILFQCHPVKKLWFPLTPGTCLVLNPVYLSIPIVSVTLDLLILALPIPMVYHLQVSRRTKLLLMGIFALSGCTIVTGIMRLWQTAALQGTADTTWTTMLSISLSIVEYNLSIICACLMVLRPFFRRHLPILLGTRSRRTGETPAGGEGLYYDGPSGPRSKSSYNTKVSGGGRSGANDSSKKSHKRGLFSNLSGTLGKDDYEDLESQPGTELKEQRPSPEGAAEEISNNSSERDVAPHNGTVAGAWHIPEGVYQEGDSRSGNPTASRPLHDKHILKTVSLDVR